MARSLPESILLETIAPICPMRSERQKSSTLRKAGEYPLRPSRAPPVPPSSPKAVPTSESSCYLRQTPPPNHPAYDYLRECLERVDTNELRTSARSGHAANDVLATV